MLLNIYLLYFILVGAGDRTIAPAIVSDDLIFFSVLESITQRAIYIPDLATYLLSKAASDSI